MTEQPTILEAAKAMREALAQARESLNEELGLVHATFRLDYPKAANAVDLAANAIAAFDSALSADAIVTAAKAMRESITDIPFPEFQSDDWNVLVPVGVVRKINLAADTFDSALSAELKGAEAIRAAALEEALIAVTLVSYKHVGNDAYSQGMDAGARHQHNRCLEAIRSLASKPGDGR